MPVPPSITGAVSGVVLLAGLVGFAVGLPELVGDEPATEEASSDGRPVAELLPEDILDGGLQRIESIDPQYVEMANNLEEFGTTELTEAFGTDVAVGRYATPDLQVEVSITIYDGDSGLFLQTGPPVPPEMSQAQSVVSATARIEDAVCVSLWQTEAYQSDGPPFQVQCQTVVGGRTFNAYASGGVTAELAVEILDDVLAQADAE